MTMMTKMMLVQSKYVWKYAGEFMINITTIQYSDIIFINILLEFYISISAYLCEEPCCFISQGGGGWSRDPPFVNFMLFIPFQDPMHVFLKPIIVLKVVL